MSGILFILQLLRFAPLAVDAFGPAERSGPKPAHRVVIEANTEIGTESWVAGRIYELRGAVRVRPGATLRIAPGVRVEAAAAAQIVVPRTARIVAAGTLMQPVVFGCSGSAPSPGCWGGIVIQGFAPINSGGLTSPAARGNGQAGCRELTSPEVGGLFGGCDPNDSSGVLRYVRIENADHTGLRLEGVGRTTVLDYIQVNLGLTDGMNVAGGTANLRHIVFTANGGTGLRWSSGWTGKAQFLLMQLNPTNPSTTVVGVAGENLSGAMDNLPRSAPQIYNLSVLSAAPTGSATAIVLAAGTAATLRNVLVHRAQVGVDLEDAATCSQLSAGALVLTHTMFAGVPSTGDPDNDPAPCSTYASPNVELNWIQAAANSNQTLTTQAEVQALVKAPTDLILFDGRPAVALPGIAPPSDGFFDAQAAFLGAVASVLFPTTVPWHTGWTAPASPPLATDTPALTRTVILQGRTNPWDIAVAADGALFFTEKCLGLSVRHTNGTVVRLFGTTGSALVAPDLVCLTQSGVNGVALDPGFASNRTVYVFMTSNLNTSPRTNRVIRLTLDAGYTTASNRVDIVTDIAFKDQANAINSAGSHSGGRIRFGPDGYLYITTGDNHNAIIPQSPTLLGGKVLRVTGTGAAAPGNAPPAGFDARIYTYGHRNVQGITFRPGTGQPFIAEHGPNHTDEVTALVNGGNGGWDPKDRPSLTCPDNYCGYAGNPTTMPMTDLTRFPNAMPARWNNTGLSQGTGPAEFLVGSQWRAWNGRLAVGIMGGERLAILELDAAGNAVGAVTAALPSVRYRALTQGPDGNLYVATDAGEIWRITPSFALP